MFFTSEYSFWWLLLIALFATALSYLLYKNDKYLKDIKIWLKSLLFTVRFISIFLISFFLIKPFISDLKKEIVKPQLLILQDNTQSIRLTKDSLYYLNEFKSKHREFEQLLTENSIEYINYSFSDSIVQSSYFDYSSKTTNISEALTQALDINIDNNIGGILLLSDGIYNQGFDPYYLSQKIHSPIYTIGLGDTTTKSDLMIQQIRINKIGFTEQNIPFSLDISSENIENKESILSISENDKEIYSGKIQVNKNTFFLSIDNVLKPLSVGIHALDFKLSVIDKETNTYNNKQTAYINIVDSRQKILILSAAPHPDISAIKYVLSKQVSFEVESYNIRDFKGRIEDYNLVILHQIPNRQNPIQTILQTLNSKKIPVLSIITNQTNLKQFKYLEANVAFSRSLNKSEWIEMSFNKNFPLFTVSDELSDFLNKTPPIVCPMLKTIYKGQQFPLSYQKIKNISTDKSAIFFTENEDNKYGFILGEGIWKWKLYNFRKDGNFNQFTDFINKIATYLSIKKPKDAFLVDIKNQFEEYESVNINVQLYNDALETVNKQEVNISYKDENNNEFTANLNPNLHGYSANLGSLRTGKYSYKISSKMNHKDIVKEGTFVVIPSVLEYQQLKANHQLLKQISEHTNAHFFELDQWFTLVDSIKNNPKFKSKVFSSKSLSDLINYKWILILLVLLLSVEWFIRKYSGTI